MKKIKSLGNSDDGADQITGRKNDNTLEISIANLELKHWSYLHNFFQFGAVINYWMKEYLQLLVQNKYIAFCIFRTLWLIFHTMLTNTCLKLKVVWSKSATKTPEWCHAVFIFNFEHIQQIDLIFLLLTLDMYLSVWHRIESTKKLKITKCTLNNRTVSLKYVATGNINDAISLVTCVSRHGLNYL